MNKLQLLGEIAAQAARGELVFPISVNGALKLLLALGDPDCPMDEAIRLVLAEPLLAARTVALANSAAFNRHGGPPITSARAALLRMGYCNLHALAGAMVVRNFGSKIADPALRAKANQLWQHTVHVAALAHVIARRVTFVDADTALFAGIVHEVSGLYLLSRADEFPGLLDHDGGEWIEAAEEVIRQAVMKRLLIPAPVSAAIENLRHGLLSMPPDTLLDTLLIAKQLAPVASPLRQAPVEILAPGESVIDWMIDGVTLKSILEESSEEVRAMSAALLV